MNSIKKYTKDLNRYFIKEDRDANKHMRRCSTSYVIREFQIKTTMSYHHTPIRMGKIQNTIPKAGKFGINRNSYSLLVRM